MAGSSGMHVLSRFQEDFFLLVAKLHIYEYEDYKFCRLQGKFGKALPQLTEEDFLALRACELHGTFSDWIDYNLWSSVDVSIPDSVREKEVSQSFSEYYLDEEDIGFSGDIEDLEAFNACALYGTAEDWDYYLSWVESPVELHDHIRETEVDEAFKFFNPNISYVHEDDRDSTNAKDAVFSDDNGNTNVFDSDYVKDRGARSKRIKGKYLKDKKHVSKISEILEAKCVKAFRDLPSGYTVEVCMCEDEDGLTIGKRAVHSKSFTLIKADNYLSSHHGLIKSRERRAESQEHSWLKHRFGIVCEEDTKYSEVEPCYILSPIYIDTQMSERYRNSSHGGSLKRKVSYTAERKPPITDVSIRFQRKFFHTGIIYGGPGLPGI